MSEEKDRQDKKEEEQKKTLDGVEGGD